MKDLHQQGIALSKPLIARSRAPSERQAAVQLPDDPGAHLRVLQQVAVQHFRFHHFPLRSRPLWHRRLLLQVVPRALSHRSMMSALGSVVNIFQTGWLYNYLIKKDVSIPIISSWAGITYGG